MLVYQGTTNQFIDDVRENKITEIMSNNFKGRWGYLPHTSESNSWQNSLTRVRDLIEIAGLRDNVIALEYEVPYNQNRIDCLLFGKGADHNENIVLIELKQWSSVVTLEDVGNYDVETYIGGEMRIKPHPSQQAEGYHNYLKGFLSEFEELPPLVLFSCAYCHNYKKEPGGGLFKSNFEKLIEEFPIYAKDDTKRLADKIKGLLANGDGFEIFNRFMQSPVRPAKKLLENVSKVIKNEAVFSLLNEQLVAKNLIWSKVSKAQKSDQKSVIIVHGGPGTGKSVIAINVLADAARRRIKVFYGCKSKPFVEGLKKLVGKDGALLFSNLYRFLPSKVKENELELLLVDEAHRVEKTSNHRFTRAEDRTDLPQIDQLINAAKTAVFFIDDKQNVRSQEIGNSSLIRETAGKYDCQVSEVTLETQYRCMGSNDYLLWLESVLGYSEAKRILRKNEVFDFQVFDSPQAIYDKLKEKEALKPNSARMTAGFCWPWSKELADDGSLVADVKIGDFAMPWETHGQISRPPEGFVKWFEWAYLPQGFKQVGCIYTAQGFEFDYVGVIVGDDLIYERSTDSLATDITATEDPTLRKNKENFDHHVKNIYRTLLTRGMKGCYVYFTNKETEAYFLRYMEQEQATSVILADHKLPLIGLSEVEGTPFVDALPLVSLKAAAGNFGESQAVENDGWIRIDPGRYLSEDMFVAQVVGRSMEPLISDGSYCIFRANPQGSRQGKVVLVEHHSINDPETGGQYTVKRYSSEKIIGEMDAWHHTAIHLEPENPDFEPIVVRAEDAESLRVVAELIEVLGT